MRQPGGRLDLRGYVVGDGAGGRAGLELDLGAKLRRDLSLVATGRAGQRWGDQGAGLYYELLGGLRWVW